MRYLPLILVFLCVLVSTLLLGQYQITGELKKWHKVTITFDGPFSSETANPNPFKDYRLTVEFKNGNRTYLVPGYFAADGNAANSSADSGNKWRVHFSPDETGTWSFKASFRQGTNVALNSNVSAGQATDFDGTTGTFNISPTDKSGRDHRGKGRLEYVGQHYLQFAESGEYFLKIGADAPENFLAYDGFDNTPNNGGRRKSWGPHIQDWKNGDPTWKGGQGKGIIGAINYLASEGQNVFSFLTMNIQGDDKNVFPYPSDNQSDRMKMDCSKLDQWEIVFEHADKLGLYLHFKTQETENDQLLDGGNLGDQRKLYYRELIARYSHHLALNWNIGEENTNTDGQRKAFAQYFYDNDPYKHNIVVHTYPGGQEAIYGPLTGGQSKYTGVSIQTGWANVHFRTLQWVKESYNTGKKWIVANDEQATSQIGVPHDSYGGSPSQHDIRHGTLYGTLMAGGAGVEYYFGYELPHSDLTCQDYRSRSNMWKYNRYAHEFFTQHVPFWEMQNHNALIDNDWDGNHKYCYAKPGEVYVIYLRDGGTTTLNLQSQNKTFQVRWFDPRNGGGLQTGSKSTLQGGGNANIGNPPSNSNQDWLVLVTTDVVNCPVAGTVCDDNNPSTYNDKEDGNCQCQGTPCPPAGTACNDGNPNTVNDVQDGNCNCNGSTSGGGSKILVIRGGPGTGGFLEGGSDQHLSDVFEMGAYGGNTAWGQFGQIMEGLGFEVVQQIEGPASNNTPIQLESMNLNEYALIIFGSNNAEYPQSAVDKVENYIRQGGSALFISDANWGRSWGDAPTSDQPFLDRFGWEMNQDNGYYVIQQSDFLVPAHPIFENVSGFDGEGVSPITVLEGTQIPGVQSTILARAEGWVRRNTSMGAGPTTQAQPNDAALVVATVDNGRIAGHYDRNTFFNPNGIGSSLNHQSNRQYAENLIRWLTSPNGCLPAGTACNDNDPSTFNDIADGDCGCQGTPCPPAGTACNDNDPSTTNDVEDGNCNCAGSPPCLSQGTPCDDGLTSTFNDQYDDNCNCVGTNCPPIGTPCDDGNPLTDNDVEDGNCNCQGTPQAGFNLTCPPNMEVVSTSSNGASVSLPNPAITSDCPYGSTGYVQIQGPSSGQNFPMGETLVEYYAYDGCGQSDKCTFLVTIVDDASGCPTPVGSACDDGDPCTVNDVINSQCECVGTLLDTDNDGVCDVQDNCPTISNSDQQDSNNNGIGDVCDSPDCPPAGTTCDDGNPNTINDVEDGNCNCKGIVPTNSTDIWLEAECATIGNNWSVMTGGDVSNGNYIMPPSSTSLHNPPVQLNDLTRFTFNADQSGAYTVYARVMAKDGNSDSFWVRANDGEWQKWNRINADNYSSNYQWDRVGNWTGGTTVIPVTFQLISGQNTLDFGYREPNVHLDKVCVAIHTIQPTGFGEPAVNCQDTPCLPAGTSCNDNNPLTFNDVEDGDCNCQGTPCPPAGTACDDGNELTENDQEDGQCNCSGTVPRNLTEVWIEAECGDIGANWSSKLDPLASGSKYLLPPNVISYNNPPDNPDNIVSYEFDLAQGGLYKVFARVRATNDKDDSFWVRANGGDWQKWNRILVNQYGPIYQWDQVGHWTGGLQANPVTFQLNEGANTLEFGVREPNIRLDKLFITQEGSLPINMGADEGYCTLAFEETDADGYILQNMTLYPNPAVNNVTVNYQLRLENIGEESEVILRLSDLFGQTFQTIILDKSISGQVNLDVSRFPMGTYVISIHAGIDFKGMLFEKISR